MITLALLCYFAACLVLALGICRSGAIEDRMLNESAARSPMRGGTDK